MFNFFGKSSKDRSDFKSAIRDVLQKIKGNKYFEPAVLSLLRGVPVAGDILVEFYDRVKASDKENITKEMKQFLEDIQKFDQEHYDKLTKILEEQKEKIFSNTTSLSKLLSITGSIVLKLDEIQENLDDLKNQQDSWFKELKTKIEHSEKVILKELKKLNPSYLKFKSDIPSEKLIFFLRLQTILNNSREIFLTQNEIAHKFLEKLIKKGNKLAGKNKGLDHALQEIYDKMDQEDLKIFQYIRKVTDNTRDFNSQAKDFLIVNEELVKDLPRLIELLRHISAWQAKYELLKENPSMCLIYVGPDQNAGFPFGFDKEIADRIEQLKIDTNLHELD